MKVQKQQSEQLNKQFQPLLKIVKTLGFLAYSDCHWTNSNQFTQKAFTIDDFKNNCEIYEAFAKLPIEFIKIEVIQQQCIKYVILKKQQKKPLMQDFQSNKRQTLEYIEGEKNMQDLMNPCIKSNGNQKVSEYSLNIQTEDVQLRLGDLTPMSSCDPSNYIGIGGQVLGYTQQRQWIVNSSILLSPAQSSDTFIATLNIYGQ